MKRGTFAALTSTAVAVTMAVVISSCASNGQEAPEPATEVTSPVPAEIDAANITWVNVEGLSDKVVVFDIMRDGRILTCTTKNSFRAGVSCLPAAAHAPANGSAVVEDIIPETPAPTEDMPDAPASKG